MDDAMDGAIEMHALTESALSLALAVKFSVLNDN